MIQNSNLYNNQEVGVDYFEYKETTGTYSSQTMQIPNNFINKLSGNIKIYGSAQIWSSTDYNGAYWGIADNKLINNNGGYISLDISEDNTTISVTIPDSSYRWYGGKTTLLLIKY